MNTPEIANNNKTCPVCGSDMKRDKSDNIHDEYCGNYICENEQCAGSGIVRN